MELNEESLSYLEAHVPELFSAAVTQAYWGTLASGHSVLQRYGDSLVEIFPDGTRRLIEALPPRVVVKPGMRTVVSAGKSPG